MKTIIINEEQLKRVFTENIEDEYLDRFYGIPLKRYMNMSDEEKDDERLYKYCDRIYDFLNQKHFLYMLDDDVANELEEACNDYDYERVIGLIKKNLDEDVLRKFFVWCDYNGYYGETPTYDVMDYTRDVHNEWLIHFSDNAYEIMRDGFRYATDDMDALGYSGAGQTRGKTSEGFNFAYIADECPRDGSKYGEEAVMFRASGVKATHYGDNEEQVMFWNKDAKDIVYIQNGSDSYNENSFGDYVKEWFITSWITGEVIYDSDNIDDVIAWVQNNFEQYRRHLINPKESKIRNKSLSDSNHNYNYKVK